MDSSSNKVGTENLRGLSPRKMPWEMTKLLSKQTGRNAAMTVLLSESSTSVMLSIDGPAAAIVAVLLIYNFFFQQQKIREGIFRTKLKKEGTKKTQDDGEKRWEKGSRVLYGPQLSRISRR